MGQDDVMPGRLREECVVVGETGMQNCNFTVFLPSIEVPAALDFLVEVVFDCIWMRLVAHFHFRHATKMNGLLPGVLFFDLGLCKSPC